MKPSPFLLERACQRLGVSPNRAVMIGDSVSDIAAGRSAGVSTIAYANKPDKMRRLKQSGADAVVVDLAEVLPAR